MDLKSLTIAMLVTDGFEHDEMTLPRKALQDAGVKVVLISPHKKDIKSWKNNNWAENFTADKRLEEVKPEEFDALVLPGGVKNPDLLRVIPQAVNFVKAFANKPIAAICHGPWTLINAGLVKGKKMTSWPSLQADLENAGATWVDKEVVVDGLLVTSRQPADIPAFNREFINLLKKQ